MSKRFIFSSVILLVLFICALFAPYLSNFDPQHVEISNKLMPPDAFHLLGTDQLGRDVLSRLLHGARYSLFFSLTISLLEVVTRERLKPPSYGLQMLFPPFLASCYR